MRLYYSDDDIAERGWHNADRFIRFLVSMRDDLIDRLSDANPNVAEGLRSARQSHTWSKMAIDFLVDAADKKSTIPLPSDSVSLWFKPVAANKLKEDGIRTLDDLMSAIRMRGRGWYHPIPYLGRGKAEKIAAWLRLQENSLGKLPTLTGEEPVVLFPVTLEPGHLSFAPFERMNVIQELNGHHGLNRHPLFPLIDARNDYQAAEAYLYKYRGRDKTYRSYQKEIERFILWCVIVRGRPLSSMLVADCEAYKDFLDAIPSEWRGVRRERHSMNWKPFAGQLSQGSKRYSVQILRAFFEWLAKVRYLAANPWVAVQDPLVEKQITPMHIGKALPSSLWDKLTGRGCILDSLCSTTDEELIERYRLRGFACNHSEQIRLVRAIVLLLGETGMRREELVFSVRRHLQEHPSVPGIWRLNVLGKRSKWRCTYLTGRSISALKAHWQDRGEDFSFEMSDLPLVSPVIIPPAPFPRLKHNDGQLKGAKGFSSDGVYKAITTWFRRIAADETLDLTEQERSSLRGSGVHAIRHTFGTLAIADGMPLDVAQKILGHSSLNTTSIYVQSEDRRAAEEVEKWVSKRDVPPLRRSST